MPAVVEGLVEPAEPEPAAEEVAQPRERLAVADEVPADAIEEATVLQMLQQHLAAAAAVAAVGSAEPGVAGLELAVARALPSVRTEEVSQEMLE